METRTGNTAVAPVMPPSEEKPHDDIQARLLRYRTSTAVLSTMVKNSVLTDADYEKGCVVLADKYGLSLCSIFR